MASEKNIFGGRWVFENLLNDRILSNSDCGVRAVLLHFKFILFIIFKCNFNVGYIMI